jgi:hypothetical protein
MRYSLMGTGEIPFGIPGVRGEPPIPSRMNNPKRFCVEKASSKNTPRTGTVPHHS